jgi:hypothetical protein
MMRFAHARLAVASVAAFGVAAALLTSSLAGGGSAAAATAARPAASSPVLVSCTGQDQVRPSSFVLSCADGNWGIEHITWATWGSTAYAGTATVYMNDCDPYCASKHAKFYHFPALITAWRAQPLPGHQGMTYFTRLSWIYTGKHCMPAAGGKTYCAALTGTFDLAPWPVSGSPRTPE